MINPQFNGSDVNEALARQRQHELLQTARQVRLARQARRARPHRLRSRTGWWLVQAGIRMVLSANPPVQSHRPVSAHHTV
ncbi:MAG: hypothetical protein ACRD2C_06420 [Acidimicrobiales bacterium]